MKSVFALIATLAVTTSAFAADLNIEAIAKKIKNEDTRTVVKIVENTDGNPCMPEGKSYMVEVQVKTAAYDGINNEVIYTWETVKEVGVDQEGRKMEVCGE